MTRSCGGSATPTSGTSVTSSRATGTSTRFSAGTRCTTRTRRCSTTSTAPAPEQRTPIVTNGGAVARRARWDFREVNVLLVVVLVALTGVMAAIGWWYRPGSSAYPTVGRRLALSVKADTRSLVLTMTRTRSGGAVLTLYDDDRFFAGSSAHGVTPGGWTVGIDGLGAGRVVRRPRGETVPIPAEQTPFDHDRMPIPRVHGGATHALTEVGAVPEVTYA